jgi:hypothetical protein
MSKECEKNTGLAPCRITPQGAAQHTMACCPKFSEQPRRQHHPKLWLIPGHVAPSSALSNASTRCQHTWEVASTPKMEFNAACSQISWEAAIQYYWHLWVVKQGHKKTAGRAALRCQHMITWKALTTPLWSTAMATSQTKNRMKHDLQLDH